MKEKFRRCTKLKLLPNPISNDMNSIFGNCLHWDEDSCHINGLEIIEHFYNDIMIVCDSASTLMCVRQQFHQTTKQINATARFYASDDPIGDVYVNVGGQALTYSSDELRKFTTSHFSIFVLMKLCVLKVTVCFHSQTSNSFISKDQERFESFKSPFI